MNTVNSENFNETMEGYIKYAMNGVKMSENDRKKFWNAIRWAKDEMTMKDARLYSKNHSS